jgi:hypothetical protein
MSEFFENGIVRGVLATLVVVLVLGIFGWLKFKWDEKIVARFLKESGIETGGASATTDAIASATRLSEVRIRKVCRKSRRIEKHEQDKDFWKLS